MALFEVLVLVTAVTALALAVSLWSIVGIDRMPSNRQQLFEQARIVLPYVLFLGIILGISSFIRGASLDLQWLINQQLSALIYDIEGNFVAELQRFRSSTFTTYFSLIYVYGYAYLLAFPIIAYALADKIRSFRMLTMAYALNYIIGLLCYILFIAYGPRNYIIGEGLLYATWPEAQFLTSEVNTNTNVFPSLHTSLSVTVAMFSLQTRDLYPRWPLIAIPLATSVCISTMYLGIHWATDVVAGVALAIVSVHVADRYEAQFETKIDVARRHCEAAVDAARDRWQAIR